jgi:hypothetical protein
MIPPELIQKLLDFCAENHLGLGAFNDRENKIFILLLADKSYNVEHLSIIAAHMLLTGVITGEAKRTNDETKNAPLN